MAILSDLVSWLSHVFRLDRQGTSLEETVTILLNIAGIPVYQDNLGHLTYTAGIQIDGDGSGPSHGDPDFQPDTTLHFQGKPLNADWDAFVVVPAPLIVSVVPVVLGARCTLRNTLNGMTCEAVVADVGPSSKLGEASIACARALGIPSSPTKGGDSRKIIEYEIWPGVPAVVDGRTYSLQPFKVT